MSKKTALLGGILAMGLTVACSDTDARVTGPTPIRTANSSSFGTQNAGLQTSPVGIQTIGQPQCPTVPPLLASFNLIVQAPSGQDVTLQNVAMTFTDTTGLSAPSVTLPAPALTRQFGSTLVEARSQRAFPLTFPFGCGTGRSGTLVVIVVVSDAQGQETTAQVATALR